MANDLIQTKNPRTGQYILIDRITGEIIEHKETDGAYKDVPEIFYTMREGVRVDDEVASV
jgi:hypothetical protein